MRLNWPEVAAVVLVSSLTACASAPAPPCHAGQRAAVEDTLYFGTQKPDGVVTSEEWSRFLAEEVTPRFPQGLTVLEAAGQWQSPTGTQVREASHVLQLVHPDDAADETRVAQVVAAYKTRFAQQSVLRVKVDACVSD